MSPRCICSSRRRGGLGELRVWPHLRWMGPISSHWCWFEAAPAGAGPQHSQTCRSQRWPLSWVESWFETEENKSIFTLWCVLFFFFQTPSVIYRLASTLSSRAFVVWALSLHGDAPGKPWCHPWVWGQPQELSDANWNGFRTPLGALPGSFLLSSLQDPQHPRVRAQSWVFTRARLEGVWAPWEMCVPWLHHGHLRSQHQLGHSNSSSGVPGTPHRSP